jgi:uncharacterized membrane protein
MTDATTGVPPGPARDYLARLVHLTGDLPPHAREDLLSGIEEHLRDALDRGELTTALARLGRPEEVAAAARHEAGAAPSAPPGLAHPRRGRLVAAPTLLAVLGLTALGAALAVASGAEPVGPLTPHPTEVALLVVAGLIAGVVAGAISLLDPALTGADRWVLVAGWGVPLVALPVGAVTAAAAPEGARWFVALAVLALGAWSAVRVVTRVEGARRRVAGRVGG